MSPKHEGKNSLRTINKVHFMSLVRESLLCFAQKHSDLSEPPKSFEEMADCYFPLLIYQHYSGETIDFSFISVTDDNSRYAKKLKEIKKIQPRFTEILSPYTSMTIDSLGLAKKYDLQALENFLTLLIMFATKSKKQKELIERIKSIQVPQISELKRIMKTVIKSPPPKDNGATVNVAPLEKAVSPPKDEYQLKQEELEKSNNNLKQKIEEIQKEIQEDAMIFPKDQPIESVLAGIKSEVFTLETQISYKKTKTQKLAQVKRDYENSIMIRDDLKNRIQEKQEELRMLKENTNEQSILREKLQTIRLDPQNEVITKIRSDVKKYASSINALIAKENELKHRIQSQQSFEDLTLKKAVAQKIEEQNNIRKSRIDLHLSLLQKQLRSEVFQKEMRSLV